MPEHVFTYGSLMYAAVWERVVCGRYPSAPALVAGHARFAVRNASYPGLIAAPGASVRGVLYFDVDDADLAALDNFEGPEYRRQVLSVTLDTGEKLHAATYLYIDPTGLSTVPWQPEAFRLEEFLRAYCSGSGAP